MSIELSLLTGVAAAAISVISLLKPLISSFLQERIKRSVKVSIKINGLELRSFELHGETGEEAIKKLLNNLAEVKNGDKAVDPK